MTHDRDPRLQALFDEARKELDGEAFTAAVMARTRFLRYRMPALYTGIILFAAVCALLLLPALQDFAWLVARGLTTNLVDLGEGWLGFFLSPVNTIGSVFILGAKLVRMGQKRLLRASFSA